MVIKPAGLHGPHILMELVKSKWDESPNPGKNHAPAWFMIAVKTSKFSPRRVNKHHSAVSAMRVLMCKDPMGLFDTLLRFSSSLSCPFYPCTCTPLWHSRLWTLTPKPWRLLKGASCHHDNLAQTFGIFFLVILLLIWVSVSSYIHRFYVLPRPC